MAELQRQDVDILLDVYKTMQSAKAKGARTEFEEGVVVMYELRLDQETIRMSVADRQMIQAQVAERRTPPV